MSGWFGSWFGKGNATNMNLEETEDKLVFDEASQKWIKQSELNNKTSSTPSPMPPSSPLPPQSSPLPPTATPPVSTSQPHTTSGRRPRYIDPFTQEVHQSAPPVVEIATTPVV
ncbi:hypothetical protein EDI_053690 [Entamoeba dispar SAW760]|uniref:Uncharacterized protein n=1 Tax=Entamoeba dispar (strain ATCC PRA-260 / SAW760) TaxID=370354 RepID=B0E8U8_ENTDS|nr:uncharacterized protein EDI_053690 [Entamoeba dispar SAW760]EDR29036.1 hypothetical protein EDI_053690 [Entamoeba dispar SAW760]|eukprot:EDR29036.1 hypothetical protein EDI_053690 [Entamoeba dispar SAW760]